ncbi:helix-turn-helix transcriptional regulator [Seohaeicola saemankumensis]|uniref:helix-turn-helix transcriptional regulator n=1 Tax=Seohaeicola saemankumensis TaxID=481181 RepID=UPI001E371248|nr:helix-turn-helix transcriptional regulator [Seohaeicola saemankumensis]MCD1627383.1 helix-turn-helix transcriptional regulator [Seohaeicola saemankumensis]
MMQHWVLVGTVVAGVAALKTVLLVTLVLTPAQVDMATVSGLFALFFALTAGVGYLCYGMFKTYADNQRKKRLSPGESMPVAKETVIARHAPKWGLSQSEADVAIFVAKGFSNNEIAEMRGSALATVKSQLGSIYQKSGLENRYQLIAFVTDEIVDMAQDETPVQRIVEKGIPTRNVLPLAGRSRAS